MSRMLCHAVCASYGPLALNAAPLFGPADFEAMWRVGNRKKSICVLTASPSDHASFRYWSERSHRVANPPSLATEASASSGRDACEF
jgi:hypothetical protein